MKFLIICALCLFTASAQHFDHYANPSLHVSLNRLTDFSIEEFPQLSELSRSKNQMAAITAVYRFKSSYFKNIPGGGKYIAKRSVREMLRDRTLTGCHDHGLILVSILRKLSIPAIMVDAAGIEWGLSYPKRKGFSGHIFVEAFVNNHWILLNSTEPSYIEEYDPKDPVIHFTIPNIEEYGFYTMRKGTDPVHYGIDSVETLNTLMKHYAQLIQKNRTTILRTLLPRKTIIRLP